jgi:acetyl esterase/lipase
VFKSTSGNRKLFLYFWIILQLSISCMRQFIRHIILILIMQISIFGESIFSQAIRMDLYSHGSIPNMRISDEKEVIQFTEIMRVSKVQTPDIVVYLPSKKSSGGEAVIICPGGGYSFLSYDWEGTDIAKFWNSKGVAAIVLKYRLPSAVSQKDHWKSPLMDAQRAMRLVRYHSAEWNINPDKVGIMGFSAGGHLAASLSTHFDAGDSLSSDPVEQMSCRPDFSILVYPVISFVSASSHSGSRRNLMGENNDPKLAKYFSPELNVSGETPPTILIHSIDDKTVPVANSLLYYDALIENKIPAELHTYQYGGHGYSLAVGQGYLSTWPERCFEWLKWYMTNSR